jgi:hypothetical protein
LYFDDETIELGRKRVYESVRLNDFSESEEKEKKKKE